MHSDLDADVLFRRRDNSPHDLPENVCQRCRSIDWSLLGTLSPPEAILEYPMPIRDIHSTLMSSTCPLCRFLAPTLWKDNEPTRENVYVSTAHSRLAKMHHKSGTKRTAFVVSAESRPRTVSRDNIVLGIIHPDANLDDFTPRLISPDKIDYDVVLEWFSLCQNLHHDCHLREAAKNLPDLKMIDCTTKGVVAAPDRCDYVALSYVWGLVSNQSDSTWPLVVEDSISVTRSLGFRYLWVDRYCIDQDESESKMTQIAQMNRIYSNAQTTIVAAAGNGPYYGLPGVSSRTRKRQGTFEIDGIILAEVFPDTRQALDASTWISRAWTYQESFLSRRRLIFTDRQVSFVCNTMFCAESIHHHLEDYPNGLGIGQFHDIVPGARSHPPLLSAADGPDPMRYATEYSQRSMSYDSDALNAILGVFTSVREAHSIVHLWGVPAGFNKKFDYSRDGGLFSLTWYHEAPSRRREFFPSWSWVGWEGRVSFWPPGILTPYECDIEVIESDGTSLSIEGYVEAALEQSHISNAEAPRILKITAPVLKLPFVWKKWDASHFPPGSRTLDGMYATAPMIEGVRRFLYIRFDEPCVDLDELSDCVMVVLSHRRNHITSVLLLVKPEKDKFKRVGVIADQPSRELYGRDSGWPYAVFVDDTESIIIDPPDYELKDRIWLRQCEERTILLE